ncbi:hypothetical protein, partial [Bacteroides faecis]|uniref:hypothetical protein n=1 Tax=Bacteroides faecis TaxID=674529 RepID=UPI001E2FEC25
ILCRYKNKLELFLVHRTSFNILIHSYFLQKDVQSKYFKTKPEIKCTKIPQTGHAQPSRQTLQD